ncbi:MAG: hypothetical protein P1P90_06395 [Patescibacteria group bacterium]|nr:hypothetical protein [Patescibacteria group bacterium]
MMDKQERDEQRAALARVKEINRKLLEIATRVAIVVDKRKHELGRMQLYGHIEGPK